jgi:hypothetical protein
MSLESRLKKDNEDFASVLRTPEGARVIAGLMDFCGVFDVNPEGDLFREGMRNVGLLLYRRTLDVPGGEGAFAAARDKRNREIWEKEDDDNG